jgi:PAS domain S-box-containing protein
MTEKNLSKLTLDQPSGFIWDKMIEEIQDYAFMLLDRDGTIISWNKGAEAINGYKSEEIIGKNFRLFYSEKDRDNKLPEKLMQEAQTSGKALHEGWRLRKDGSSFWGSVVLTAFHDDSGKMMGFSKVTRDLTERKYSEDLLKEKNRELERINQELTSFAYVASHDLQEPLRKIQTFASRIMEMEKQNFSEKTLEYFQRMQGAAGRMQTLIQDLLTYSRTNTAERKIEAVDLNKLIGSVKTDLDETIREKNAVIESEKLPVIEGVQFQFHQLFLNLIGNALKFSRKDVQPKITISSSVVRGEQIKEHVADPRKKYHQIEVRDNGIGFEPEYNEKIFEVFQRLHGKAEYSGNGIGLSICKKIVENHRGFIRAEGIPGDGAVFYVVLPAN